MRRFLWISLLALAVWPASADFTLDCMTRARWGSRGSVADFAIEGTRVIVADGRGISVYDAENPRLIRQLATARTERPSISLKRAGERFAVLTVSSVDMFEERDGILRRIDSATVSGAALAATSSHVVVGGNDVTIWRIGTDGTLAVVTRIRLDSSAADVALDGVTLYIAERETGISLYEIGATSATRIASIALPAKSIAVANDRLFAASGLHGVSIVDVSSSTAPRILSTTTEGLTDARALAHAGDFVWLDDDGRRLVALQYDGARWSMPHVVDISSRAFGASGQRLYVAANGANVVETDVAFRVYDAGGGGVSISGELRQRPGSLAGVAIRGEIAYVADPPFFRVLDLSDSLVPRERTAIDLGDSTDRVRLEGNLALVYGTANVHLIDIARPFAPKWIGTYRSQGLPRSGAAMAGNVLVEGNRASGFHVVDITDPASPRQTSGLRNDGYGQFLGVVAMPGVAYATVNSGVKVVDLSNPQSVRFVAVISAPTVYDLEIAPANARRSALLLLLDGDLLRVFDLRAPLAPAEVSRTQIPRSNDIAIDGDVAYLITPEGLLTIIDFSDPARPMIQRTLKGLSNPSQIAASDGRIAVADRFEIRLLRDPARALDRTPIVLKMTSQSSARLAHLAWSSTPDAVYELQLSESADFSSAQSVGTGRADFAFPLTRTTSARVRVVDACSPGVWSNALRISPDDFGSVSFAARGSHHLLSASSGPAAIDVLVRNDSDEARIAHVASEPAADALTIAEVTIPARSQRAVRVIVDPGQIHATREFELHLPTTGTAPYKLKITSVRPVLGVAPIAPSSLIIPAVGSAPGANGTMWRSNLHILCHDGSCPMDVRFRRYGDGANARSISMTVAAGELLIVEDAVARIFGAAGESGYLEIASSEIDRVGASAVTYNDAPTGKFGERIPAIGASDSADEEPRQLLGIAQNDAARTNVGIIETLGRVENVELTLRSREGVAVASRMIALTPYASSQQPLTALFPEARDLAGASIAVETSSHVVVYASRVDQRSGDSSLSYASAPSSDPMQIDVVGLTPGAEGTFWRTAFQITNATANPSVVDLELVPSDPSQTVVERVVLPGNGSLSTDDLITDVFSSHDARVTASARLRIRSQAPIAAWARIYNDHSAGTYGQSVTARRGAPDGAKRIDIFPLSESEAQRTNVGFGEMSGQAAAVTLRFFDGSGALIGIAHHTLLPYESTTLLGVLREAGLEQLSPVRLEIESDGNLFAYGSVVERANGDAVFISAP